MASAPDPLADLWIPEPLFDQQTVFILGGGPSLKGFDIERLRGRRVFAVNQSIYLCPWADAVFFMDTHWFDLHRPAVDAFQGLIITSSRHARAKLPDRVKEIAFAGKLDFEFGTPVIKFSRSSGHAAIALAVVMGAVRVVLLGFDMRRVDGRSHYHDEYPGSDDNLYAHDFLKHFDGWNEAARRCGVRILNCTPGSALTEFPAATLDEVLAK